MLPLSIRFCWEVVISLVIKSGKPYAHFSLQKSQSEPILFPTGRRLRGCLVHRSGQDVALDERLPTFIMDSEEYHICLYR